MFLFWLSYRDRRSARHSKQVRFTVSHTSCTKCSSLCPAAHCHCVSVSLLEGIYVIKVITFPQEMHIFSFCRQNVSESSCLGCGRWYVYIKVNISRSISCQHPSSFSSSSLKRFEGPAIFASSVKHLGLRSVFYSTVG